MPFQSTLHNRISAVITEQLPNRFRADSVHVKSLNSRNFRAVSEQLKTLKHQGQFQSSFRTVSDLRWSGAVRQRLAEATQRNAMQQIASDRRFPPVATLPLHLIPTHRIPLADQRPPPPALMKTIAQKSEQLIN